MKVSPIPEVSEDIRDLIDLAASGEEVILTKADVPIVRMVPASKPTTESRPNGPALAEILEHLSLLVGIDIEYPVAWQREIRMDRNLPERE